MRRMLLPFILPPACAWVAWQERRILACGIPLTRAQSADAQLLGVMKPDRVRILYVRRVPLPSNWLIKATQQITGASAGETAGLSARYGIFIKESRRGDRRLIAHELVHTHQYERLGGITPFLRQYLHECLTVGYAGAELEHEAIAGAAALQ